MDALPNEILCEIFELASSTDITKRTHMTIAISHVDSRWREVALDLPNLWTSIRISGYDATVLDSVLLRSKGRPLDIFLNYQQATPAGANLRLWNTLISVLSEMHRCRSLTVSTIDANFKLMRNVFGSRCMAPLLESLKLTCVDTKTREPSIFPLINYDSARLDHIYVDGAVFIIANPMGVVEMEIRNTVGPWQWPTGGRPLDRTYESLEKLTLVNVPIAQGTTFTSPALTNITFKGRNAESIFDSNFNPATLTSIEISQVESHTWVDIIHHFSRSWQLQRFSRVQHLTLSDLETPSSCMGISVARFALALSGLTNLNFAKTSPEFLFNMLRTSPSVWLDVVFTVDGIEVPHPARVLQ
jgi:hypothetical protein